VCVCVLLMLLTEQITLSDIISQEDGIYQNKIIVMKHNITCKTFFIS
jgi:hypothetical protein